MAVEAGRAEDASTIGHKQVELQEQQQEEDILGLASRATAGLIGLGRAARVVSGAAGLKGVQNFLEKMPLIGKSKKVRQAEELQNRMIEAYEEGKVDDIARLSEYLDFYGGAISMVANLKTQLADDFGQDVVDRMFPDVGLYQEFEKINAELTNEIAKTHDPYGTRNLNLGTYGR